jgi:hypothetical protein
MSPLSKRISLANRFYPMENPSCGEYDPSIDVETPDCIDSGSSLPDGTGNLPSPVVWQPPNGSSTSSLSQPNSSYTDNGTNSGGGTSTPHATAVPNSSSTSSHSIRSAYESSATPSMKVDGDTNNIGAAANVTATTNTNSTNHISGSVLATAVLVPTISLVVIAVILYLIRSCWKGRKAKIDEKKSIGRSEPSESGSTAQFANKRANMEQPIDMVPIEPAYRAWISPQIPRPEQSHVQDNQPPQWSNINLYDDHRRELSPVSAYVPSIPGTGRSRRSLVVSALDYNPAQPDLPTLEDGQGHFMPPNFGQDDYYNQRSSHQPLDNIDSFLSPRQEVQDHWRAIGGTVPDEGEHEGGATAPPRAWQGHDAQAASYRTADNSF